MGQISIRMSDERIERLDREADDRGLTRAELVRDILESRNEPSETQTKLEECRSTVDDFRSKVDELQTEVDRLNRERRQLLEQRQENQELVKFAKEQRSVVSQQREEERWRRQANIVRRTWWRIAGEPDFERADS